MNTRWAMAAALTAAGAIVACSGSADSSGGQYDSCLQSLLGGSCISCLQSHCGGAVSGLETGCGDYLGCICPGGNFSAPNAQSTTCSSKLQESSCISTQGDGGALTCDACQSACAAVGGSQTTGGTVGGNSSGSSGGGASTSCGNSFLPGTMAVTLSLTGVDLGDGSPYDWRGIGFNLDGKCTTNSSTDTCTLAAGASLNTQDDGTNGIDNSYGQNVCPILAGMTSNYPCSSGIKQAYLQTDANGTGTLVLSFLSLAMFYPVHDVHITLSGSGGMAGGVIPTAGFKAAWQNAAGCISTSLCSPSALQSVLTQFAQASDIGADGSNTAGTACDGVSFGIRFTGSTTVSSLPSAPSCSCP